MKRKLAEMEAEANRLRELQVAGGALASLLGCGLMAAVWRRDHAASASCSDLCAGLRPLLSLPCRAKAVRTWRWRREGMLQRRRWTPEASSLDR
jgi:hypothetical protein